jgi:hypothetical protein
MQGVSRAAMSDPLHGLQTHQGARALPQSQPQLMSAAQPRGSRDPGALLRFFGAQLMALQLGLWHALRRLARQPPPSIDLQLRVGWACVILARAEGGATGALAAFQGATGLEDHDVLMRGPLGLAETIVRQSIAFGMQSASAGALCL